MQGGGHDARRVLCPVRYQFPVIHWSVGRPEPRLRHILPASRRYPGLCWFYIYLTHRNRKRSSSNRLFKQVIGPFLIVIRVANQSALTSSTITSGNIGTIQFRSEGKSTGGNVTLPDRHSVGSMDVYGGAPGELGVGVEGVVELPHDKV